MVCVSYRHIEYLGVYIRTMTYISPIAKLSIYRILNRIYTRCIGYLQHTLAGYSSACRATKSGLLYAQSQKKAVFKLLLYVQSEEQRLLYARSYGLLNAASNGGWGIHD
jgi:hypothetical protein